MIQKSDLKITATNVSWWLKYLQQAKELNSFVKSNFGKEEISGMSIAPIIKDLHKENEVIEQAIADFRKRKNDVLLPDHYYMYENIYINYGSPKKCKDSEKLFEIIHVIKGSPKSSKRLLIERFIYHKYDSGHISLEAKGDSFGTKNVDSPTNEYLDLFYLGELKEVDKQKWDNCIDIYKHLP